MKNKRIELLSPAGDMERLKITLLYGADAVYLGGKKYGLRANANNFSVEEIKEACDFAHNLEKRVYLTLNIVFHNEDIEGVYQYIDEVVKAGIDAFIVSDPFIISYIKENYSNVEVHLSTQNSTTNTKAIEFFKSLGVNRVVLARECSKNEIEAIIKKEQIDVEVFIHGAMCTFYSGRCALSNYLTNRDSNRGGCSQVCRFVFDTKEYDQKFTVATKDLNMANYIKDLIEIGVCSLKVEGRMRSLYYLATVIGSYRKIIDAYYDGNLTDKLIEEQNLILSRVANRETSTHYFTKEASWNDQYYTGRQEMSNQDFLAIVLTYDRSTHLLTISERNYFDVGEKIELFTPNKDVYVFTLEHLYNEQGDEITCARHPEEILKIKLDIDKEIPKYSMLRRKVG